MALLKFYTKTCEPCKKLSNLLETEGIETVGVDAKEAVELVASYGIRTVPTLVHEESGEKLVGLYPISEIRKWINTCNEKLNS